MGLKFDKIKNAADDFAEEAADKAVEVASAVSNQAKKGFEAAQKTIEETSYDMRMKRYNPLFLDAYKADGYALPQMVVIADGEERKNIDVCEGAIGWTIREAQLNVVHLYSEFVGVSGITFFPSPKIDSVYMVDPVAPNRYIDLGCYFKTIEDEKIAELIEVGRCLGARKCTVETYEAEMQVFLKRGKAQTKAKAKVDGVAVEIGRAGETSLEKSNNRECKTLSIQEFDGSDTPQRPTLYWFKNDVAINNLIHSICDADSTNKPKRIHREAESTSASTMLGVGADQVEAALMKMGVQINFSFEGEVKKESRQTWALDIEF